jgi:predicted aminopeptidase
MALMQSNPDIRPTVSTRISPGTWLVMLASLLLSGCYVLHTATGQLGVMSRREPIERVVSNPKTAPNVRTQLERVVAIRKFAVDRLGLPDNGSYLSYADIGRPFVVWNVFATPEFSVEPQRWCFPIAGCVAYRGYFKESMAVRFAEKLRGKGADVFVGGVAAYSTLGHFEDPVLNTMIGWTDVQLASIIFHELSHQLLYVTDDSAFNEAFASVVEDEGVRRWLAAEGRPQELDALKRRQRRYLEFATLLIDAREDLRTLYATRMPEERKREAKAEAFRQLAAQYESLRKAWGGAGAFDEWSRDGFNNAHLMSVATYQDCVPGLERLLQSQGNELAKFYEAGRALADMTKKQRHAAVCTDAETIVRRQVINPPMGVIFPVPGAPGAGAGAEATLEK